MRLLAATDFSEGADFALDRAVSLASTNPDTSLTVMHVRTTEGLEVVRQMFSADIEKMERAIEADAQERLRSLAARCERTLKRKVEIRSVQGRPEAEIIRAETELSVDLIVMGERGRPPARFPCLGGTVERVLQRTSCSILAVKKPMAARYRRVLVCVSSGDGAPAPAELAFLLTPGSEIILLNAFEAAFENKFRGTGATESWITDYRTQSRLAAQQELAQLGNRLEAVGIQARRIAASGPAAPTIIDYSRSLAADLIVVGKRRGFVLGNFIFGDIARQVAVESETDVLVTAPLRDV